MIASIESSTVGELGNYLEPKSHGGKEGGWLYNTWGLEPEQLGYLYKGDSAATHAAVRALLIL